MLITVGTRCTPCSRRRRDGVVGQPGAVLDAVDAGGEQPGQGVLAEHVGGDPGAAGMRDRDRLGQHVVRPERREIADGPVDPVADDLDPAVAVLQLPGHLGRAVRPGRRDRRPVRGCTAGSCAMCRPARISTGRSSRPTSGRVSSGEPQSRSASAPACRLVLACSSASSRSAVPGGGVADVAVRVDETRQHEAGELDRIGDRAVDERAADRSTARPGSPVAGSIPDDVQAGHLLLRELELGRVEPGRQLVQPEPAGHRRPRPHPRRAHPRWQAPIPGNPPGMPLTFGWVGPRPVDALTLAALGMPSGSTAGCRAARTGRPSTTSSCGPRRTGRPAR